METKKRIMEINKGRRVSRLLSHIVKEYGEYPQSYRGLGFGWYYVKLYRGCSVKYLCKVYDKSGRVKTVIEI